ncbi:MULTISPECIES: hypothetical protein [Mesorhizobium]|uniref:hypothetical protein n=1 Tax=Mesorhizobium TaxID=68287 RepID=UPI0010A970E2|nr:MULTISPECIES: hypothetical protein [Mesorhizobium]
MAQAPISPRAYDGFYADSSLGDEFDPVSAAHSEDPWTVYLAVLRACKSGNFAGLGRLPALMTKTEGYFFWRATTEIIGYAGNWKAISGAFSYFESRISNSDFQYFFASALGASCNLKAVTPLLQLHQEAEDEESRHQIENHLSYLLEGDDGPVWDGASQTLDIPDDDDQPLRYIVDRVSYFDVVQKAFRDVRDSLPSEATPVYEGKTYDVGQLAQRLLDRLRSDDRQFGRINRERVAFEAATGLDTRSFYTENGTLLRLPAAAIVEGFLDSDDVSRFRPGQRYFFGHPIPE